MKQAADFVEANEAIEALTVALHSSDGREAVLEELARLEMVYSRGDEATRFKVITELINIELSAACEFLTEALRTDKSAFVRHEAAFGLGIIGVPEHVSALSDALRSDESEIVRHEAAISLSQIGDETSLPILREALKDPSDIVVASSQFAIRDITLRSYLR